MIEKEKKENEKERKVYEMIGICSEEEEFEEDKEG